MSEVLPKGWAKSCLAEVCTKPQYGWTTSAISTGNIKLLRTTDISNGKIDWEKVPYCQKEPDDLEKFLINENDILVSRAGSVGISYRITKRELLHKAVFASYLIRFCPLVQPSFIGYYLRSHQYWSYISDSSLGIAVPNVNASKLSELPVPLPPFNEQKRIVTKLDSIIPRIEVVKERLEKVPAILKRFRQSVLTAAVTGKLTEKWREGHPDVESVFPNLTNESYELPDKWCLVPFEKLIKSIRTDVRTGPFGTTLKKSEHQKSGVPVWGIESIGENGVFTGINKIFVTKEKATELKSFEVKGGDIIISRSGTVGELCILPENVEFGLISTNLLKIVLNKLIIDSRVFCFLFKGSSVVLDKIRELCSGSTRLFLTQGILKRLEYPLPPLKEQKEIVRQVDKLFTLADKVEDHYKKAKAKIDNLSQSVLAKAFRGELVPQDPNDEPAEKLLERIMEEKAKMESALKAVKKKIPQRNKKSK